MFIYNFQMPTEVWWRSCEQERCMCFRKLFRVRSIPIHKWLFWGLCSI
jgi:hypothetical protein